MEDPTSDGANLSDLKDEGEEKFVPDPDLQDWQNRVLEEAWELNRKVSALDVFIELDERFRKLPSREQARMEHQAYLMQRYLEVLEDRIDHFV